MRKAPERIVEVVGTMTLGPRSAVAFLSRPVAFPRSTVLLRWGDVDLRVRVTERSAGVSHGHVLETIRRRSKRLETGLEAWKRRIASRG